MQLVFTPNPNKVQLINPDEMRRALRILTDPGQLIELRAINALTIGSQYRRYTASGYFNDIEELIKAAHSIIQASGIYITLNPCKRGLITRANNRIRSADDMRIDNRTTKDEEIICYRWLPIDVDPVKTDGNDSASDSEHEAALHLTQYIYEKLQADGWPKAVSVDSGNGGHLYFPLHLPNTEAGRKEVESILKRVASRFDTPTARVDTGIFNPARIMKLAGTRACKGDATEEWPHRMSRILSYDGGDLS